MSSINKSTSKKKKADYSDDLFLKPIVESSEEAERKKQEKIKRVLKSYHKGMTQADALSALDELSDVVTYDEGLCDMGKKFLKVLMEKQDITEFQALIFSALFCVRCFER